MMAFLGCRPVEGPLAGLFFDDLQFEGGDTGAITWGDEIARRGQGGLAGPGHRLRHGWDPRRHPPEAGRPALHDRGQEPRSGRHVVGEPLPRRPCRRRQPPVLLLLRARRSLERVLLPAAGAARLLHRHRRQVRPATALPVRHHCHRVALGRPTRRVERTPRRGGRHGGNRRSPFRHQRRRFAEHPETSRHPRHGHLRRALLPLGSVARGPAVGGNPVRADRRRCERVPDRPRDRRPGGAADDLPAHRAVDHPESPVSRGGAAGRPVGAAAPAVLRPLVPVHHDVRGHRRRCRPLSDRPDT